MISNNRPANIAFMDEARGGREPEDHHEEDITILEEEEPDDRPVRGASSGGAKKKGVPMWIFAVGGAIILIALVGGGLMVKSMMDRVSASDEIMPVPSQPISQPEIQQDAINLSQVPVGTGGASLQSNVAEHSVQTAPPSVPHPTPSMQTPLPAQAPVATQQTQGVDSAKIAVLEDQLNRALAGIAALSKRLDDEVSSRSKLGAELSALKEAKAKNESAAVKKPIPAVPPVTAPVKRPTPEASKPVVRVQPKPVLQAPQPPQAQQEVAEKHPQEGVAVAPVVPGRVHGWTISSIIGSRAWLIKRNSDGTESELSVAPGERIEGVLVTSVDGASKSVTLENGQRIGVGK